MKKDVAPVGPHSKVRPIADARAPTRPDAPRSRKLVTLIGEYGELRTDEDTAVAVTRAGEMSRRLQDAKMVLLSAETTDDRRAELIGWIDQLYFSGQSRNREVLVLMMVLINGAAKPNAPSGYERPTIFQRAAGVLAYLAVGHPDIARRADRKLLKKSIASWGATGRPKVGQNGPWKDFQAVARSAGLTTGDDPASIARLWRKESARQKVRSR